MESMNRKKERILKGWVEKMNLQINEKEKTKNPKKGL